MGLNSISKCFAVNRRQFHQQIFIGTASERAAPIGLLHRINRLECSADIQILELIRQQLEAGAHRLLGRRAHQFSNSLALCNFERS